MQTRLAPTLRLPADLAVALLSVAADVANAQAKAFRLATRRSRPGRTLRPGTQTPLWNQLRSSVREQVDARGGQAKLARLLGLPRQRVHAYLTRGDQMTDAERTLQLLAWLIAAQEQRPPA